MIRGIHHFGLTVRDLEASASWYVEVLGFRRDGGYESPDRTRRKVFLRHDGFPARLGLTHHDDGGGGGGVEGPFDERHVGLDHLAFAVSDRAELDTWVTRLDAAGVIHSPIARANTIPGAVVLVLRDPDNIQLELFFDPSADVAPEGDG
jgi:glyoxylase I family protein